MSWCCIFVAHFGEQDECMCALMLKKSFFIRSGWKPWVNVRGQEPLRDVCSAITPCTHTSELPNVMTALLWTLPRSSSSSLAGLWTVWPVIGGEKTSMEGGSQRTTCCSRQTTHWTIKTWFKSEKIADLQHNSTRGKY